MFGGVQDRLPPSPFEACPAFVMGGSCDVLTGEPKERRDRGVLGFVGAVDFLLSRIVRGRVWGAVTRTVSDGDVSAAVTRAVSGGDALAALTGSVKGITSEGDDVLAAVTRAVSDGDIPAAMMGMTLVETSARCGLQTLKRSTSVVKRAGRAYRNNTYQWLL